MSKAVSSVAINALIEALTNIYWYKGELRSFIMNTINDPTILSKLNWSDYKRNIATQLVNFLVRNQSIYQNDLLSLMNEISRMEDFSHLERLDDGKQKVINAQKSVAALKKIMQPHLDITEEQKKIEERRQVAYEKQLKVQGVSKKLDELKKDMYQLIGLQDHQERGYKLEKIIRELFTLFDLDPKASFKIIGEQIDGAFTFENNDYLFEGKWQDERVGLVDLDSFQGKLSRKLDNTLGLLLSINGFSDDAVKGASSGRSMMILMDGSDLMAVLEGQIDLIQLLLRKRRFASQTGNIYLKIHEIMLDK